MKNRDLFELKKSNTLTVLSHGLGQDSSTLLEMLIDDPEFRQKYAPNDLLVVTSDTGNEFELTYKHLSWTKKRCAEAGIEYIHITPDMGFHSASWQSLQHFYKEKNAIGSKAYPKTCSDNLKIQPIYKAISRFSLADKYGFKEDKKRNFRAFAATHGKIQMLIGISKGEEKRMSDASESPKRWYRESIEHVYPLVDLGMDRQACQDYLHARDMYVIPSNCKMCPFLSIEELEYLRRFHPVDLDEWVNLEAAKLEKYRDQENVIVTDKATGEPKLDRNGNIKTKNNNYGVFGVVALPKKIEEAKNKFVNWSDERVREYRYSHGHCVSTAY